MRGPRLAVEDIDDTRTVTLQTFDGEELTRLPVTGWALLRRWGQPHDPKRENGAAARSVGGATKIDSSDGFVLEDGIVVAFERPHGQPHGFRAGDHLADPGADDPGRHGVAGGDGSASGAPEPPHGVERHFAPLAMAEPSVDGQL